MLSRETGEVISINLDELAKGQNIYNLHTSIAALLVDFTIKLQTYLILFVLQPSLFVCLY